MASTTSLQEKFNAAVKAIQQLPADGTFQPSNELKLTFYGLYKQATVGPSKEPRPSLFNYVNRAKWDAWDKYRSMTKKAAMTAYIDEIRKILETMPQTKEVLEFTQLIGPFYEFVDDQVEESKPVSSIKKKSHYNDVSGKRQSTLRTLVNGTSDKDQSKYLLNHNNGPIQTAISPGDDPAPSSSPSSSSSSISSSDADEFYGDPSDELSPNNHLSSDEKISNDNIQINTYNNEPSSTLNIPFEQTSNDTTRYRPHVYGGQNGSNLPPHHAHTHDNQSNESRELSRQASHRQQGLRDCARYSLSSIASGGGSGRLPNNNYNKETQRAILYALTKLQQDVNNVLERLNRLETSSRFLHQRDLSVQLHHSSESNCLCRWFPLAGLRHRTAAFILLWPFFVFVLIRLLLRARIIIRFRHPRL